MLLRVLLLILLAWGAAETATACTNSEDDEIIAEYFNEVTFDNLISIEITESSSQYLLALLCPPPPSNEIPGSNYDLRVVDSNGSNLTSCEGNALTLSKANLNAGKVSYCNTQGNCKFIIRLSNKTTSTIYSETDVTIALNKGTQTLVPDFSPATLPICDETINDCMASSMCSLSTSNEGTLVLCESASGCDSPLQASAVNKSSSYTYSISVYK